MTFDHSFSMQDSQAIINMMICLAQFRYPDDVVSFYPLSTVSLPLHDSRGGDFCNVQCVHIIATIF